MKQPTKQSPKLAAPGAGLPIIERLVASVMIHWKARRTSRQEATAKFSSERGEILNLLRGKPSAVLGEPVLIKRLPGLEDSSRYWSLLMTLDHLRIVNEEITEVIASLTTGTVPDKVADTAKVKPNPTVGNEVIVEFESGCDRFTETVAAAGDLQSASKFAHPWFGLMDAAAWHFMAGFHMQLHRKQMVLILEGIPRVSIS